MAQIQIPIPNKYLEFGYKVLVFCRNNGWLMENMEKGLIVPKLAENTPNAPNLSAQAKSLGFWWKKGFNGRP